MVRIMDRNLTDQYFKPCIFMATVYNKCKYRPGELIFSSVLSTKRAICLSNIKKSKITTLQKQNVFNK